MTKDDSIDQRNDFKIIISLIEPKSKVLDLGCSNGALLAELAESKQCVVRGIEKNFQLMNQAMAKQVPVFLGEIRRGLDLYEANFFDYIILSLTIQQLEEPHLIIKTMLEKGRRVIVSFVNYGYFANRFSFFFRGKKPNDKVLKENWYDSLDIHPLTIRDFETYCEQSSLKVIKKIYLRRDWKITRFFPNFLSSYAIYLISA